MKNLLITLALIGFIGCSSAKKEETKEMVEQETQSAQTEAEKAMENAKEDVEAAADEMANEEEGKSSDADESMSSDSNNASGEFGTYEGTEKSKVSCTSGTDEEDVRTIAVLDGSNGGCGVVYTKFGNSETVAVAQYNMEYCPEVQNKIKSNLEAAGFTCQ